MVARVRTRLSVPALALGLLGCSSDLILAPETSSTSTNASFETSGTDNDTSTTGEEPEPRPEPEPPLEPCDPLIYALAPSTVELGDRLATPINIEQIEATLEFTYPAQASVDVTTSFWTNPKGGAPIFDLVREPEQVWLDGEVLAPEALPRVTLAPDADSSDYADYRVLDHELEACTHHELRLTYTSSYVFWDETPGPLWWTFGNGTLGGDQLEAWLPANLAYDRYALEVELDARSVPRTLTAITNSELDPLDTNHWQLSWDEVATDDPMLVLDENYAVVVIAGVHTTPEGHDIELELHTQVELELYFEEFLDETRLFLDTYEAHHGRYPADRLVAYINNSVEPTSFDAAFIGADVEAMIAEQWWRHGMTPVDFNTGWAGIGWVRATTETFDFSEQLNWNAQPRLVYDPRPYVRRIPQFGKSGALMFQLLFDELGQEVIEEAMISFYRDHPTGVMTTFELERHLYCSTESPVVYDAFRRFVHGLPGTTAPPSLAGCP